MGVNGKNIQGHNKIQTREPVNVVWTSPLVL